MPGLLDQARRTARHLQDLLDQIGLVAIAAAPVGSGQGGYRYKLHFGGKGVGPTATLYRCDARRQWERICRFDGLAAVFLQRLEQAIRDGTAHLPFEDTVQLFAPGSAKGERDIPQTAQEFVSRAVYRRLPCDVDHRDIVRNVRGLGYRLCEAVEITGRVATAWDSSPRTMSAGRMPDTDGMDENVRLAVKMLREGHSLGDIKLELDLGEDAFDRLMSQLERLGGQ